MTTDPDAASDLDAKIQAAVNDLVALVRQKDPSITDWSFDNRTDEDGWPAFQITASRERAKFDGDGWYEVQDSWAFLPTIWHVVETEKITPEGHRLYQFTSLPGEERLNTEHWAEQWLMDERIFRKMPEDYQPSEVQLGEIINLADSR